MNYVPINNTKIAVEDINPSANKTVVMLHGWPLNHKMYEYQLNILPQLGFRCVLIDLRGFGMSDTTYGGYDYNQYAADLYGIVNAMRLGRFTLVGFSMGGAIAIRYMARYNGSKVTKLALLGAAAPSFTQRPGYPYGMTREAMDMLINHIQDDRPQAVAEFGEQLFASSVSANFSEWFKELAWSNSALGTIGAAISLRDEDLRADLAKIQVPTGIFHGKLDKICPYVFAELLYQGITKSTLYPFEHSGHAVFYDELENFNRTFVTFLSN